MDAIWTKLDSSIVTFFNPLASDPSVRAAVRHNWPLHRLDQAVTVASLYLVCVLACKALLDKKMVASQRTGPSKVEKKEKMSVADKIKKDGIIVFSAMAAYNATQVALCGWMVFASLAEHRRRNLSFVCNVNNLAEDGMALVLHVFYLSKILDFADTVFMIAKNNWRQVSFLHVYHHTSVFLVYWLNVNTFYDGDIYFTIVLNGGIHFIMYGYYLVTTFNIAVPTVIKKSITNMQLIQFCCMEAQGLYILKGDCQSPYRVIVLYMVYVSTMLVLFLDFKRRTYSKTKLAKGEAESGAVKKSVSSGSTQETMAPSTDVDSCPEADVTSDVDSGPEVADTSEERKTK